MNMFNFGVDYYPEQWPEERWPVDAQLMAEAGFNVVRLAEFAWSKMEPAEGQYDFDWLDRAIAVLQAHDLRVVLGTPTASPPPWLMSQQADLFRVREDGRRVTFGNRREYCPNSPQYHGHACRIVTRMAERYSGHPAVIGWQLDNEFGERCYCSICAQAFHKWLQARYGAIGDLNHKWGTTFWSHHYNTWKEIPLPLTTGGSPNPGLALDFFRFSSDSYVAFQQMQLDILRERCPRHFVTHNFMGFKYDLIDYFDLARNLEFVSWDNYPRTQWNGQAEPDPAGAALAADTMRGLKRRNFWVMEQQAGSAGWEIVGPTPRPGELRLWAYQAVAHGADGILFFRWRTARYGAEQFWHGLLDHDACPGRRYEEIKRMGAELKRVGDRIAGSVITAPIAMLLSYDARFAFEIQPNNPEFRYSDHFARFYRALYRCGLPIDIVAPTESLIPYRLVVAPALHIVSEAVAENLACFVRAGGVLVVTMRSGVKDESNAVVSRRLPGLLAPLCGVHVEDYDSLPAGVTNGIEFIAPEFATAQPAVAGVWCDVLQPNGATVVATYTGDYYAGRPALTLNRFGQGWTVYLGTSGDGALYQTLAGWLLRLASLQPMPSAPQGVEMAERWQGDRRLLFVLNHTEREQAVTLDTRYLNLLDGAACLEGRIAIGPRDVLVLQESKD